MLHFYLIKFSYVPGLFSLIKCGLLLPGFFKNYNGTGDIPDQDSCVSKWAGCINRWAPFFFFRNRGEIEEVSLCASVVIPVCKSRCRMSEATFFFFLVYTMTKWLHREKKRLTVNSEIF